MKIRWYETDGGCCDVQDHVNGKMQEKIESSPRRDAFLPFYLTHLAVLRTEMSLAPQLPTGITHGDPFADNVLVDATTGNLVAFIDLEDVCGGPLLFDLACCAIGCCFMDDNDESGTPLLNMTLLESLLQGYCASRQLIPLEREHFVPFMRLTLLCNCAWRFVKFNSASSDDKNDFPQQAKDSYLELQRRIEYLQNPTVAQEINNLVAKHVVL